MSDFSQFIDLYYNRVAETEKVDLTDVVRRWSDFSGERVSNQGISRKLRKIGFKLNRENVGKHGHKSVVFGLREKDSIQEVEDGEGMLLTYEHTRCVTVEDALRKGGVDLSVWEDYKGLVNHWEVGAKGPDGKVCVTPLWQVKVWIRKKNGWNRDEFLQIMKDDLAALAPSYHCAPTPRNLDEQNLAELSIFDAHFGKLAWEPETGQNYDLEICRDRYMTAAYDLLDSVADYNLGRILYVVGNDFFHVDHKGKTTNDTPQDCDGRWQKAFRVGKDATIQTAEQAATIAPVDILCVSGNHDQEKVFCLGEVLSARFENHPHVNVINNPDLFSYYHWGKVLLGFVHGNNHKNNDKRGELIGQMLSDRPVECANSVWREWHLGHRHIEEELVWKYISTSQIRNFVVRTLPSLSSVDAWHRANGYESVLAAEAHLYSKTKGRRGYFVHQVDPKGV